MGVEDPRRAHRVHRGALAGLRPEWNARALAVGMVASHAGEPAHGGGDGSAHSSARLCMFHHAVHHQPDQTGSWPYLAWYALQGRAYLGSRITVYSRVLFHLPIRVRSAACARA